MQNIRIEKKQLDYREYIKRPAQTSDYKEVIRGDTIVEDSEGRPILLYFKFQHPTEQIVQTCMEIPYETSRRSDGLVTTSRIFGFDPATGIRKPYCSATILATRHPRHHQTIVEFGKQISSIYKEHPPDAFTKHSAVADAKIAPEWRIQGTPFTSGIINKNNQLNYHFDSGNFKGVYSNMIVFKNNVTGGYLSLPEYDIALECADNTLVMFDGQSILHGVTPIQFYGKNSYRYSIVYYTLEALWNCGDITTEIAKVRNRRAKIEKRNATL